ncbi:MAG: YdeI/OmpD-associated family protein [Actinomycetota bacterium]
MIVSSFSKDTEEPLDPKDRATWRAWLDKNHASSLGTWVVIHKKESRSPRLLLEDAVEEAICFGWIDSRLHPIDKERFKLWFSGRKPTSIWSQNNRNRVARLERQGLMAPAGQKAVKIAQANGAWTSLVPIDNLDIPDDLNEALNANPAARENFDGFTDSTKKMILRWIDTAKREDTRAKRISETVSHAAKDLPPHH